MDSLSASEQLFASGWWRRASLAFSCLLLSILCLICWLAMRLQIPTLVGIRLPATALRSLSPALSASSLSSQTEVASVHAMPLYQRAEQACHLRQYRKAADLLAQLVTTPGLNSEQVAFVQQQRRVCLQDAGLPVPLLPSTAPRSLTLSVPSRLLSPASADCGPRALLGICPRLGVRTSLAALRLAAGTTPQKGTSLAGLARAAKAVGLKAEGVQISREALPDVQTPVLAYVNGRHFIAVLSLNGSGDTGTAQIHDPDRDAEETISQERLLRLCSGYLLLTHK